MTAIDKNLKGEIINIKGYEVPAGHLIYQVLEEIRENEK